MDALRERMSAAMDGRLPAMFGVEILAIEHGEVERDSSFGQSTSLRTTSSTRRP